MGETVTVTDESGTEYEVDKSELQPKVTKAIVFTDPDDNSVILDYNSEHEITWATGGGVHEDLIVAYNEDAVVRGRFGNMGTWASDNVEGTWERNWCFSTLEVKEVEV